MFRVFFYLIHSDMLSYICNIFITSLYFTNDHSHISIKTLSNTFQWHTEKHQPKRFCVKKMKIQNVPNSNVCNRNINKLPQFSSAGAVGFFFHVLAFENGRTEVVLNEICDIFNRIRAFREYRKIQYMCWYPCILFTKSIEYNLCFCQAILHLPQAIQNHLLYLHYTYTSFPSCTNNYVCLQSRKQMSSQQPHDLKRQTE